MEKNKRRKLFIIIVLIILILLLLKYFEIDLEFITKQKSGLKVFYNKNPFAFILSFNVIYILSSALSLPIATALSLFAPCVFPFWHAFVYVAFSSTIGASLAFLGSRYFFTESLQKRWPKKFEEFQEGYQKNGIGYLVFLRLFPLIPFFMVNLFMGLTKISMNTYAVVSFFSMLPGIALYLNAGVQLDKIGQLSDIFSFKLILAFSLISIMGLLPKIFKKKISKNGPKI